MVKNCNIHTPSVFKLFWGKNQVNLYRDNVFESQNNTTIITTNINKIAKIKGS